MVQEIGEWQSNQSMTVPNYIYFTVLRYQKIQTTREKEDQIEIKTEVQVEVTVIVISTTTKMTTMVLMVTEATTALMFQNFLFPYQLEVNNPEELLDMLYLLTAFVMFVLILLSMVQNYFLEEWSFGLHVLSNQLQFLLNMKELQMVSK